MITFEQFWRINAVVIAVLVGIVSITPETKDLDPAMSLTAWLARVMFGNPAGADKIAHFMAYGALSFFCTLGWAKRWRDSATILGFLFAYGVLLEVLQLAGGARNGDVADLVANMAGGILGMASALVARAGFHRWRASTSDDAAS